MFYLAPTPAKKTTRRKKGDRAIGVHIAGQGGGFYYFYIRLNVVHTDRSVIGLNLVLPNSACVCLCREPIRF